MPAQDAPLKRHRASKPKARTGCDTCKRRRVKCDEARPACHRCAHAGFPCGGYPAIEPRANAAGRPKPARHARRPAALSTIRPRLSRTDADRKLALVPSSLLSELSCAHIASGDVVYFDLFRHQVAKDLSGHLYDHFWSRIVLCESTRDDCVKKAMLALGALSKAMFFDQKASHAGASTAPLAPRHPDKRLKANQHHAAAFNYHSYSIAAFRDRMRLGSSPEWPRYALIMTLLLLAFEFMIGNIPAADGIMKSGMRFLGDAGPSAEDTSRDKDRRIQPRTAFRDMEDICHLLPCLSLMSGYTYFCKFQLPMSEELRLPPPASAFNPGPRSKKELITQWGDTFQWCMQFVTHVNIHVRGECEWATPSISTARHDILRSLGLWKEMLDQRERETDTSRCPDLGLKLILIQQLVCTILASCCTDPTQMAYDSFDGKFLDMVDRCALFLEATSPGPRIPFAFNGGNLTSALSLAVSKCRHFETRMRAVQLFKRISWREGSWDRQAIVCNLGQAEMEERERDESGLVGASSRWFWSNTQWDHPSGCPLAEYTRSKPDLDGHPVKIYVLYAQA